ncbi:MAG: hypothetical protein IT381_21670 [Deltaproteobacteria bacterium]|nr:hypothetical protein [Deltaproteobacteria bacterium]
MHLVSSQAVCFAAPLPWLTAPGNQRAGKIAQDVRAEPGIALGLLEALVTAIGARLTEVTDTVGQLLRERSLPRCTHVDIVLDTTRRSVRTGTRLADVMPERVGRDLVVAALLDARPATLTTTLCGASVGGCRSTPELDACAASPIAVCPTAGPAGSTASRSSGSQKLELGVVMLR